MIYSQGMLPQDYDLNVNSNVSIKFGGKNAMTSVNEI